MQEVRAFIEKFVKTSEEEWTAFQKKLRYKEFDSDEFFLKEGQVCKHAVFIEDGAFRFSKVNNGTELVTAFFFTGDFLSDYESFLTQSPSKYYVQALKKSNVYLISKKDLNELYSNYPTFERLGRLFAERLFLIMNKRLDTFLYETPEARYAELVNRNSKLLQEVPQYMIASYLGVKPESLSRIRKRK